MPLKSLQNFHSLTSSLTQNFFQLSTPDLLLPLLSCFETRRICNKLLTNSTTRWTQGLGVIQRLDLPLVSCCFKNHRLLELTDANGSTDSALVASETWWVRLRDSTNRLRLRRLMAFKVDGVSAPWLASTSPLPFKASAPLLSSVASSTLQSTILRSSLGPPSSWPGWRMDSEATFFS